MSSFMPWPKRATVWKCPKCGRVKIIVDGPPPWIMTCIPLFGGGKTPPVCPKCKVKMVKVSVWSV